MSIRCGRFFNGVVSSSTRSFSTSQKYFTKVALLGAAGGIGQPLALLLKQSPYIKSLALYDIKKIDGLALELDHIDTSASVHAFSGESQLNSCLDGAEIVVITAGIPRKPGMERKDLFEVNAKLIAHFAEQIVKSTYNPMIAVVTNPVNSLVPVVAEVLKRHNMYDIRKLFGVTTLDIVRANSFYAQLTGLDPREVHVPVVAGHSGNTIVPLFSIAQPKPELAVNFSSLVDKVRNAGTHVVEAKGGEGSATLSMAYSAFRFVTALLQARLGKQDVVEYAYVHSKYHTDVDFFSEPFTLTHEGVGEPVRYESISDAEQGMIMTAKEQLRADIEMGRKFVEEKYGPLKQQNFSHEILGQARDVKFEESWLGQSNYQVEKRNEPLPKSKKGDTVPEREKE